MNNRIRTTVSVCLCGALLAASAGTAIYAVKEDRKPQDKETKPLALTTENKEDNTVKDETVYVLAGADGSVREIIVSDWIKNTLNKETIADPAALDGVENVKGEESYTLNDKNMRIWQAQGNDIYCQGTTGKELPVTLSVSYKLNGQPVSAEEIAGKSGKATIRFDYRNNQRQTITVEGKEETLYVPFVMLTGLLLDGDTFHNVEVSNGKLINDGSRVAVMGLAFPGLQENLGIEKEKLTIPDFVEITADVENFEMTNTVTLATNEIFSKLNSEKLDSADDLSQSLGDLTEAMRQLTDGSSQLYDGLCTLLEKSGELMNGINRLADGSEQLKNGAAALDTGVSELSEGAKKLTGGLEQLKENSPALNAGAKQIFDSLLTMANSQLEAAGLSLPPLTAENYAELLENAVDSLNPDNITRQAQQTARQKVTETVNAKKDDITAAVQAAVREQVEQAVVQTVRKQVTEQVLGTQNLTPEQYQAAVSAGMIPSEQQAVITGAIEAQMQSEAVRTTVQHYTEEQMQSEEIRHTVAKKTEEQTALLIQQNLESEEVQTQIRQAVQKAESGAASIRALKEQLDSYRTFYTGLTQYTAGVDAAKQGAEELQKGAYQLKEGSGRLKNGADELYTGILTMKNGAPALTDGIVQLRDGASSLSEGLKEFNEKGIQKLTDAVNGDLKTLASRIKATISVSQNYRTFSGLSEEMDGEVKFIYRTDSVSAE